MTFPFEPPPLEVYWWMALGAQRPRPRPRPAATAEWQADTQTMPALPAWLVPGRRG